MSGWNDNLCGEHEKTNERKKCAIDGKIEKKKHCVLISISLRKE